MIVEAIIFWLIGGFVALLGNENIRDYKCFDNPRLYLATGVFLCFLMSWAMFILSVISETYSLPLWLYHDCYKHSGISYEDGYFDKDGNGDAIALLLFLILIIIVSVLCFISC